MVTRCSRTSMSLGFSPGACVWLYTDKLEMWEIVWTVAAHIHGSPKKAQASAIRDTINKSKWYPEPFFSFRSFLFTSVLKETWKLPTRQWFKPYFVTYHVIWTSTYIRMNTSNAGKIAAITSHPTMALLIPKGLINHWRLLAAVGVHPSGISSFYNDRLGHSKLEWKSFLYVTGISLSSLLANKSDPVSEIITAWHLIESRLFEVCALNTSAGWSPKAGTYWWSEKYTRHSTTTPFYKMILTARDKFEGNTGKTDHQL